MLMCAERSVKPSTAFVLVARESLPAIEAQAFVPGRMANPKYPENWRKVSYVLRRAAGFRCEWCGSPDRVSVHHLGTSYPDGREGNRHDKHDLRRENLIVACYACHEQDEQWQRIYQAHHPYPAYTCVPRGLRRKLGKHRALGIGTGLVALQ